MDFENRALLAPLSTFTNLPFRLLCQEYGADGALVPLISARALCMRRTQPHELDPHEHEKFVGVQLFGSLPSDIGKAAQMIAKKCAFVQYIDINCACPVPKVTKAGAGAALLSRPETVQKLIREVSECGLPVTVKIRKLPDDGATLRFCLGCEKAGAKAIFFHGRTVADGYSGTADWAAIKNAAERLTIPVIGSGDIRGIADGKTKASYSGCSSFMIGRAAMSNPMVFSPDYNPGTHTALNERVQIFRRYYSICSSYGHVLFTDLKAKAIQFFTNFHGAAAMRGKISLAKNTGGLFEIIEA